MKLAIQHITNVFAFNIHKLNTGHITDRFGNYFQERASYEYVRMKRSSNVHIPKSLMKAKIWWQW